MGKGLLLRDEKGKGEKDDEVVLRSGSTPERDFHWFWGWMMVGARLKF